MNCGTAGCRADGAKTWMTAVFWHCVWTTQMQSLCRQWVDLNRNLEISSSASRPRHAWALMDGWPGGSTRNRDGLFRSNEETAQCDAGLQTSSNKATYVVSSQNPTVLFTSFSTLGKVTYLAPKLRTIFTFAQCSLLSPTRSALSRRTMSQVTPHPIGRTNA